MNVMRETIKKTKDKKEKKEKKGLVKIAISHRITPEHFDFYSPD